MRKVFTYNRKQIIYGLTIGLILAFLQEIALNSSPSVLIAFTLVGAIFFTLIVFLNIRSADKQLAQLDLPNIDLFTPRVEKIYHYLIPILTFLSFVAASKVLAREGLQLGLIIFGGLVFCAFFINARAYYEDKFKLEEETHIIYDFSRVFIFFAAVIFILTLSNSIGLNFYVTTGVIFCIASLLTLLILIRNRNIQIFDILLVLLSGLSIGYLTGVLFEITNNRALLTSVYSTVVFYILNSTIHHEVNRTLKFSMVLEYILVAGICLLVILLAP